ncbi:MAG: hypothetical protein LQ347_001034 [Umbilicaria vellea]|nr:MAG: hypothetical protein LQ347_001034 [Umbilicaria vellea]
MILSQWERSFRQLPPNLKKSIRQITLAPKKDCLSKIEQVQKSDIGIPTKLQLRFESWKHPKRFFTHGSMVVMEDTVSQVYLELRRIVDRRVDDPIRARIYAVALYDLRLLVDRANSLQLKPEVSEKIEQVIVNSTLVDDSLEDISKWTKEFLRFGERMKTVATSNGGLGALIVIPSSLLSMRQWVRLNDVKFARAVQHLQSIEVAEVAAKAEAHTVANRIHSLILQKFRHGVVEDTDMDHNEQMVDAEDKDGEQNEENEKTYSNATSVLTHLDTSDQAVDPRQEYLNQVEVGTGQQMMTDKPVHPPGLAPTFVNKHTNSMCPSMKL